MLKCIYTYKHISAFEFYPIFLPRWMELTAVDKTPSGLKPFVPPQRAFGISHV